MKKRKDYVYNKPIDYQIRNLRKLIKASGKSLYSIQRDYGIPSGFLHYLMTTKAKDLNPSFATMTRLIKALDIDFEDLIEYVPEKRSKPKKQK